MSKFFRRDGEAWGSRTAVLFSTWLVVGSGVMLFAVGSAGTATSLRSDASSLSSFPAPVGIESLLAGVQWPGSSAVYASALSLPGVSNLLPVGGDVAVPFGVGLAGFAAPAAPLLRAGPSTSIGFPGISDSNSSCSCAPPDVTVAAGPTQVAEMVNLEFKVWSKAGHVVLSKSLAKFFGTGGDFISDPKILYDNQSGRWFASIVDVTTGIIPLGISTNSSASGAWSIYGVGGTPKGDFPDQPILGVSNKVVALGANVFVTTSGNFVGGEIWVLNKTPMLTGNSTPFVTFGPKAAWFSVHPVSSLSSTTAQYWVSTVGSGISSSIHLFRTTGVPPGTVTLTSKTISISATKAPPPAVQPGTTKKIDTGDNRVQTAVWLSGSLWLAFNDGCTPSGDTHVRACAHFVELNTGTNTTTQEIVLGTKGEYVYYPSLSLSQNGNLSAVFGFSSSTIFPSVGITGRGASAPLNTLEAPLTIHSGSKAVLIACSGGVCRFGDYFGAGYDPTNPNVWVAAEFVTSGTGWSTWIAAVRP